MRLMSPRNIEQMHQRKQSHEILRSWTHGRKRWRNVTPEDAYNMDEYIEIEEKELGLDLERAQMTEDLTQNLLPAGKYKL